MRRTSRTGSRFQSTLPRGSDVIFNTMIKCILYISIHAPSRERLFNRTEDGDVDEFQSTLPRGSDRLMPSRCYYVG